MSDQSQSKEQPKDIRWIQRFDNFKRAYARLSAAAALAKQRKLSELEEQGLVQAFEFTHELAWNTFKDFLTLHGTSTKLYGSRDATREAFAAGLIENGGVWMKMIEHRNETTHTYNEAVAAAIVEAILSRYVGEFEAFKSTFEKLEAR
jgi:nucleotidyltransferase substrate binding protein (TIGR01987 family)